MTRRKQSRHPLWGQRTRDRRKRGVYDLRISNRFPSSHIGEQLDSVVQRPSLHGVTTAIQKQKTRRSTRQDQGSDTLGWLSSWQGMAWFAPPKRLSCRRWRIKLNDRSNNIMTPVFIAARIIRVYCANSCTTQRHSEQKVVGRFAPSTRHPRRSRPTSACSERTVILSNFHLML